MTNIKPTPFTVGQVFIYQGVIAIKVVSVQADGCTGEDLESPGNLYGFTEEHRADLVEKV